MRPGLREDQESDPALLLKIKHGDEQALTRLFQRHSKLVFSIAMRVLNDREDAEDVLQEIFMQVWRKPFELREDQQSLEPLLAVMTRNRAVDSIRKRRLTESVDDLPLPSPTNLASASETNLLLARVREIAGQLPREQQIALDMAFFQGLTHSEIAAKTETPLGTVKTRIRTAVNLLERTLKA
jgi:RNA polymerase sigma-70 factor, ECF subfamily